MTKNMLERYLELYKGICSLPRELIVCIVEKLMLDGYITYTQISEMHIKVLEEQRKKSNELADKLQTHIVEAYTSPKKYKYKVIDEAMLELYNLGKVNLSNDKVEKIKQELK